MMANYRANLNVEGCGAVVSWVFKWTCQHKHLVQVAAPDGNTPGGSYYFHWMRDAGLSIKVPGSNILT